MSIYKILIILFLLSYDIMTKKKEKNMTLAQLRYVITVSQVGTLSEAAKRLYISQPSLRIRKRIRYYDFYSYQ